ncbi:acylglycerol kinase family protein [Aurantiacibacter spongiae]|uniref:DAGKc domain-containing protein n=1 Tax=Aurantiacibacter spongiae TaxID=2488860 RepID=A0A3N5CSS2_9SPHN|nr:acylglycerol kinase family protein [Aurantiacibacter spongiae]RPF71416.1 hypothetical protein EG799_07165 [Aurantiacibacter spongiae]
MADDRPLWLIHNADSGSNAPPALQAFHDSCEECGLRVAHTTDFPEQDLPTGAMLDTAGIETVVVFAGDGTINAALDALSGWSGSALILPGGTMNLLYHRLFGELEMEEAIDAFARGRARRRRPGIIASELGNAYAGLLAGPGTRWNTVREDMRGTDIVDMPAHIGEAFNETLSGDPIRCTDPDLGRREGYPLLLLTPHDDHCDVTAYHAETVGEFLEQTWALVRRDFREGPHDLLGRETALTLQGVEHGGFGVLLDGEPQRAKGPVRFALAEAGLDLLSTLDDD